MDSSRPNQIRDFFANSEWIDYQVLRPLWHFRDNWELSWDPTTKSYEPEENSFADLLNALIQELAMCEPPKRYHDNEDRLGEFVQQRLNWPVRKVGNRWVGKGEGVMHPDDYLCLLQQGGFYDDAAETQLVLAAAGRIRVAIDRGQNHFDAMEESHRRMLAGVLTNILYHRS